MCRNGLEGVSTVMCRCQAPPCSRFRLYTDKTEEVRRLGMGRLLSDLSHKMLSKAENGEEDPMKILIHSTHDTALAGLCSTLDVFDER